MKKKWIILASLLLTVSIGVGAFLYINNKNSSQEIGLSLEDKKNLAEVSISELDPGFYSQVSDYIVDCQKETKISIKANGDNLISFNGGAFSENIKESLQLKENESFSFQIKTDQKTYDYNVRCTPTNFPSWEFKLDDNAHAAYSLYAITPSDWAILFDKYGVPVWWKEVSGVDNLQVLPDGTFSWSRGLATDDSPKANFSIHDLSGRKMQTLKTKTGPTDQHEFQVLPNGNYLMDTYAPEEEPYDLSPLGGPSEARVVLGVIEEITPEGESVEQWHLDDFVPLKDRQRTNFDTGGDVSFFGSDEYIDVHHLNSVDFVSEKVSGVEGGAFLISLRFTDAVYLFSKKTSELVWKIGGREIPKSLEVIGDPEKKVLEAQHDARYYKDGTISVFDNRSASPLPRMVSYKIDPQEKTATFVEEMQDKKSGPSPCCGSARRDENGGYVVAWGNNVVTEFDKDGKVKWRLVFDKDLHTYRAIPVEEGIISVEDLRQGMDDKFKRGK